MKSAKKKKNRAHFFFIPQFRILTLIRKEEIGDVRSFLESDLNSSHVFAPPMFHIKRMLSWGTLDSRNTYTLPSKGSC